MTCSFHKQHCCCLYEADNGCKEMQIVLGEALAASLFLCEVVEKSARFPSWDVRAAQFSRTPVVAKVFKCCFPACLSPCWCGIRKKSELVRAVCEIMRLVVRDCLHFVRSLSFKPLLACLEARNDAMDAWTTFIFISFQLWVAHLYMFRK